MRAVEARAAEWIDIFAELITTGGPSAVDVLGRELLDAFDAGAVVLSKRDVIGRLTISGWSTSPQHGAGALSDAISALHPLMEARLLDQHPGVVWYAMSGSNAPISLSRLPVMFRRSRGALEVVDVLRAYDIAQQLSLPAEISGRKHTTFVMLRPTSGGFSDDDVALATRIQPLLIALQRQLSILDAAAPSVAATSVLTSRELAVLSCVAQGMTSTAIGGTLLVSNRTVEKHLEHVYRKLAVRDKVSAVRAATEAHLLTGTVAPVTGVR